MTPYNVVSVEALSDSMVRVSGAARCFAAVGVRAARVTDGASSQNYVNKWGQQPALTASHKVRPAVGV